MIGSVWFKVNFTDSKVNVLHEITLAKILLLVIGTITEDFAIGLYVYTQMGAIQCMQKILCIDVKDKYLSSSVLES